MFPLEDCLEAFSRFPQNTVHVASIFSLPIVFLGGLSSLWDETLPLGFLQTNPSRKRHASGGGSGWLRRGALQQRAARGQGGAAAAGGQGGAEVRSGEISIVLVAET